MHDLPALAHRFRLIGAFVAWMLLAGSSPGVLTTDGLPLLGALAIAVWAHVEARPVKGRAWKGFFAHVLGAAPGAAATMLWIRFVYPPPLVYVGLGIACYSAIGGVLLRAMLRSVRARWAAPLCAGLAWTASDVLRCFVPMPFGVEWFRLGHVAHAWLPLAESARVWGVAGLTFALASLGGGIAFAYRARGRGAARLAKGIAAGLAPSVVGLVFGALTGPPDLAPGPRVLVVQPGFEQARKQLSDPGTNFKALAEQTRAALAAERTAGNPEPDLVMWGESMLYVDLFEDGVLELAPERVPNGYDEDGVPDRQVLGGMAYAEELFVRGMLFGVGRFARQGARIVPDGSSLMAGAIDHVVHDGKIRRINAAVVYDAEARRSRPVAKRYLVPGAESMYGLERFDLVRDTIYAIAGYVPDMLSGDRTGVLPLTARDGRRFTIATTICFDNSHMAAYTDPVGAGRVDFHAVLSNEAWYEHSFEADQMVAFTRIAALASGRAIVRATNSGISLLMGPDGRELGRITGGDDDRMIAGHLAAVVPVPADGADAGAPPIARLRRGLDALVVGLAGVLAALGAFRRGGAGALDDPAALTEAEARTFAAGGNPGAGRG